MGGSLSSTPLENSGDRLMLKNCAASKGKGHFDIIVVKFDIPIQLLERRG